MTLDTRVFILDKISPQDVFWYCRRELLGLKDSQGTWYDQQNTTGQIGNNLGQGFPAILDVTYGLGVPLYTPEQAAEHEDWCNFPGGDDYDPDAPDCDGTHGSRRACWAMVGFDTSYGYTDTRGYGCGDLHADYVSRLGLWLDGQGVRWEFRNEFTGEVHGGKDRYAKLIGLSRGGFEATAWFRNTVLPAIANHGPLE